VRSTVAWLPGSVMMLAFIAAAYGQWSGAMLLNDPPRARPGDQETRSLLRCRGWLPPGIPPSPQRRRRTDEVPTLPGRSPRTDPRGRQRRQLRLDEYICEAGNGDIHITWRMGRYAQPGWTRSADGGLTFLPYIELTSFLEAPSPRIAPYGPAGSAEVLLVVSSPP